MVIKFPFNARRSDGTVTRTVMLVVWVTVTFLAALPLVPIDFFSHFYGRSGVCLALHITNEKPNGWQYAVFIFIVLNFLSFAIIAISYLLMYTTAKTTQKAARDSDRVEDPHPECTSTSASMGRRMTLIVVTDAACWLPIIGLGIVSLAGMTIPPQIYAWVAVFVLPLNAAVNPVLYTLSTAPVRKKINLFGESILSKGRTDIHPQSLGRSVSCSNMKSSLKSRLTGIPNIDTSSTETRLIGPHTSVVALTSFSLKSTSKEDPSEEFLSEDEWTKKPHRISRRSWKGKLWSAEMVPLENLARERSNGLEEDVSYARNLKKNQIRDDRYN